MLILSVLNKCTLPPDHTLSNCPCQVCNCDRFEDKYHTSSFFLSSHLSAALIALDLAVIRDDGSYLDSHQVFCHTPIQVTVLQ